MISVCSSYYEEGITENIMIKGRCARSDSYIL